MNPVIHFELPFNDSNRATTFYSNVFSWKFRQLGPEMDDYVLLTTTETDVKPGEPIGTINGGTLSFKSDRPAHIRQLSLEQVIFIKK